MRKHIIVFYVAKDPQDVIKIIEQNPITLLRPDSEGQYIISKFLVCF